MRFECGFTKIDPIGESPTATHYLLCRLTALSEVWLYFPAEDSLGNRPGACRMPAVWGPNEPLMPLPATGPAAEHNAIGHRLSVYETRLKSPLNTRAKHLLHIRLDARLRAANFV